MYGPKLKRHKIKKFLLITVTVRNCISRSRNPCIGGFCKFEVTSNDEYHVISLKRLGITKLSINSELSITSI